ncbi:MAG: UDP-3-O-[3-hydroxymyristoyl] N-acetylglucosamine deacetylase [Chlamydiae bacterium]|nr:UDP-3-O-[3-hydroxymyristoyl] N-acetylglucosamine deacetylase [Chlamydiota bacterium]
MEYELSTCRSNLSAINITENATCVPSYTLKQKVSLSGVGLFTGQPVIIELVPAKMGTGIIFERTDLPGSPRLLANLTNVISTPRCTILGSSQLSVQTVEHLLSALAVNGINHVVIRLNGPEVPIFDGSAAEFVNAIEEAGIEPLLEKVPVFELKKPIYYSHGDIHMVGLPCDSYKVSYTLNYPGSLLMESQFFSLSINSSSFKNEIASSRTFSVYEEILPFIEKGLLKGGSLENAVLIKNDKVMNPDGLRFPNEMVRHKILDLIGDLSLIGVPFKAHIIAIRSGHHANNVFAKEFLNHINSELTQ